MDRQEFENDVAFNWAMYDMFALLRAMVRYKAFPGTKTEQEAISALKAAAPYFGKREVKQIDNLLNAGESNGHE